MLSRFYKLFPPSVSPKLALGLGAGLLAQIGYWYLGSPGPTLLYSAQRTLGNALINIGWALVLLLAVPLLLLAIVKPRHRVHFGVGNWQLGLPLTLGLGLALTFLMYLGSSDSSLQGTYPWPGAWAGKSIGTFALWGGLYALYYVAFEFFYRGFLIVLLRDDWGLAAAVWVQVLLSTLIHLGKPLSETLAAFPAGFLFAFLALRTRSLLWPILLHLCIGLATDYFSLWQQGWLG